LCLSYWQRRGCLTLIQTAGIDAIEDPVVPFRKCGGTLFVALPFCSGVAFHPRLPAQTEPPVTERQIMSIRAALLAGLGIAVLTLPAAAAPAIFDGNASTVAATQNASPLTQVATRKKKMKRTRGVASGGELPRQKAAKTKPFDSRSTKGQ
jgi:hypothetical protein